MIRQNLTFIARRLSLAFAAFALILSGSAMAQFSNGYNFLKAVRDRDGAKVTEMLNGPGSTLVNTREQRTGETGLLIVVARRDVSWMAFLLQNGADPNLAHNDGVTPLMLATTMRFIEGAQLLLQEKAKVDQENSSGETPLIRAVQLRDLAMVRLLLKNGADPDKIDNLAGRSARDYASNDVRAEPILAEIESSDATRKKDDKPATFGPEL